MKKTKIFQPIFQKTKEKTSRISLTFTLAFFVFLILIASIALTILGLYILIKTEVLIGENGDIQYGTAVLFVFLISIVLGGAIAFFGSKIPLRPINDLINKLNRLAAGDFKARLCFGNILSSHPAFDEMSTSFNLLAEELESTEMLRGDFINNFSHEFKTPIVSIAGFAKLLAKGDLDDEQKQLYLKSIEEESMRLSAMATNVLNLTKVENQTILTDVSVFNLSEQIRFAVLLFEEKWTKKNIEIQLDFNEIDVEANEELLKEIWINLLDNAIKFSPDGAVVTIEATERGNDICVAVSNTDSEIPLEKQDKIFNKFYQTDESHATKGNGIGLAIVKRILELHGGAIMLDSGAEKTTFTVVLPKKHLA